MTPLVRLAVGCCALLLLAFAGPETASRAQSPIEEQFKYGSIGSEDQEGIPYWIWQVLPRMFADKLPDGGQSAIRRVLINSGGAAKTVLAVVQEKNAAQGRKPATRVDLRLNLGAGNQIFLLNKGDGTIRVVMP